MVPVSRTVIRPMTPSLVLLIANPWARCTASDMALVPPVSGDHSYWTESSLLGSLSPAVAPATALLLPGTGCDSGSAEDCGKGVWGKLVAT